MSTNYSHTSTYLAGAEVKFEAYLNVGLKPAEFKRKLGETGSTITRKQRGSSGSMGRRSTLPHHYADATHNRYQYAREAII